MKKVLVILLLIIFSAQGAVVALGGGFMTADGSSVLGGIGQAQGETVAESLEEEDFKVSSSIEEMSDYVALDPPPTQLSDRASSPPSSAPALSSIDLPRALPPPRG